jgi:hypothetical protein
MRLEKSEYDRRAYRKIKADPEAVGALAFFSVGYWLGKRKR